MPKKKTTKGARPGKSAQKAAAHKATTAELLQENRRRFVRFAAMCKVEYAVDERVTFAFSQNLSVGGMLLRNARGLVPGENIDFVINASESNARIKIRGNIVRLIGGDVAVRFVEAQASAEKELRAYVDDHLVSKMAERVSAAASTAQQVHDLAMYYREIGRVEEARELYQRAILRRPNELGNYENLAVLLLQGLRQAADQGSPLFAELDGVLKHGIEHGKSTILEAVWKQAAEIARSLERRKQDERRREKTELSAALEQENDRRLRTLQNEAATALKKATNEKKRELEKAFEERRAEIETERAASADAQRKAKHSLSAREHALEAERTEQLKERARLERKAAALEKDREALNEATEALAAKQKELRRRHHEVDEKVESLGTSEKLARQIEQLKEAAREAEDKLEASKEKLSEARKEAAALGKHLEKERQSHRTPLAELDSLKEAFPQLSQELERANAEREELAVQIARAAKDREALERRIAKQDTALQTQAETESRLREAERAAEDQQQRYAALHAEGDKLEAKLRDKETALVEQQAEAEKLFARIALLDRDLTEAQRSSEQSAEQQRDDLENRLAVFAQEREQLEHRLLQQEQQLTEQLLVNDQLLAERELRAAAEQRIARHEETQRALEAELSQHAQAVETHKGHAEVLRAKAEALEQQTQGELVARQKAIALYESNVHEEAAAREENLARHERALQKEKDDFSLLRMQQLAAIAAERLRMDGEIAEQKQALAVRWRSLEALKGVLDEQERTVAATSKRLDLRAQELKAAEQRQAQKPPPLPPPLPRRN